ncbi:uncharacterized protein [Cherax quadricarinatus]
MLMKPIFRRNWPKHMWKHELLWRMASTRMLIVRGSLLLNALLVLYLCVSWFSTSPTRHTALATHSLRTPSPLDVHHVDFEGIDTAEMVGGNGVSQDAVPLEVPLPAALASDLGDSEMRDISLGGRRTLGQLPEQSLQAGVKQLLPGALEQVVQAGVEQMPLNKGVEQSLHGGVDASAGEQEEPPREVQESAGVTEQLLEPLAIEPPDPPLDSLERKIYPDLRECSTRPQRPFYFQRGDYWVLENYIPAALSFRCDESITYTTHADYTFLDNLEPLTSRWQGPVSVAVYAPGDDFNATINTILYLRDCWAEGIKKYVTFHLFFHVSHKPKKVPSSEELLKRKTDCALEPPRWTNVTTYRQHKKLLYPVNIARNTARQAVQTYFVFPSDVELYPSINFIPGQHLQLHHYCLPGQHLQLHHYCLPGQHLQLPHYCLPGQHDADRLASHDVVSLRWWVCKACKVLVLERSRALRQLQGCSASGTVLVEGETAVDVFLLHVLFHVLCHVLYHAPGRKPEIWWMNLGGKIGSWSSKKREEEWERRLEELGKIIEERIAEESRKWELQVLAAEASIQCLEEELKNLNEIRETNDNIDATSGTSMSGTDKETDPHGAKEETRSTLRSNDSFEYNEGMLYAETLTAHCSSKEQLIMKDSSLSIEVSASTGIEGKNISMEGTITLQRMRPREEYEENNRAIVDTLTEVAKRAHSSRAKLLGMGDFNQKYIHWENLEPHGSPETWRTKMMDVEWIAAPVKPGMSVFHIGKRKPPFHKWEPIYIGTNREPLYDERLSWEGKSDKMTQMYILCVRDYEFHILDNAFLVHKPGIKKIHKDPFRDRIVAKQNSAISSKIFPEYKTIFGFRKSCVI